MNEKRLSETLEEYQKLAKENTNIDLSTLALSALANEHRNTLPQKQKNWAYLISVGLPPLGLLFAVKYYLSDEDDAKTTAHICVALTLVGLIILWISIKVFSSSSGVSLQQIQQIKPGDIQQLTQ